MQSKALLYLFKRGNSFTQNNRVDSYPDSSTNPRLTSEVVNPDPPNSQMFFLFVDFNSSTRFFMSLLIFINLKYHSIGKNNPSIKFLITFEDLFITLQDLIELNPLAKLVAIASNPSAFFPFRLTRIYHLFCSDL